MEPRIILLVGLPGAGKSTVGPLVARALGLPFVDLDQAIERAAGVSVAEVFEREGEGGFRRREGEATRSLSGAMVLAPGGGWLEDPRNRQALSGGVLSVYLRIDPEVALQRLSAPGSPVRPLLEGPEPLQRLRGLLARREAAYLQSDHTVMVDSMSPEEVASSIVAIASGE